MNTLKSDHNYNAKYLKEWSCIIVTCPSSRWAKALQKELEQLQRKGFINSKSPILTVGDPSEAIGSGTATINALLVASDFLSAQNEYGVMSTSILKTSHILILHHGRRYMYDTCGKGSIFVPGEFHAPWTNLQHLLWKLRMITATSPPGVWVCSTDLLHWGDDNLKSHFDATFHKWDNVCKLYCVEETIKEATNHGTIFKDDEGFVQNIVYCGDEATIAPAASGGKVSIVAGIVFLPADIVDSLLAIHLTDPLDCCHFIGYDSGTEPLQMSLFFDILLSMASGISEEDFIQGKCGKTYNTKENYSKEKQDMQMKARTLIWKQLCRFYIQPVLLGDFKLIYWSDQGTAREHFDKMLSLTFVDEEGIYNSTISSEVAITNSLLINNNIYVKEWTKDTAKLENVVITSCDMSTKSLRIGKDCLLQGLRIVGQEAVVIPDNVFMCRFVLVRFKNNFPNYCTIIMGLDDSLTAPMGTEYSTFCGLPWEEFLARSGIDKSEIWDVKDSSRDTQKAFCLLNARLFPKEDKEFLSTLLWLANPGENKNILEKWQKTKRFSIEELFLQQNVFAHFQWIRGLCIKQALKDIPKCLNQGIPILPYLRMITAEGWHFRLLKRLDNRILTARKPPKQCLLLTYIAELFSLMAGKEGGLRSGPGNNRAWASALNLIQNKQTYEGILRLRQVRKSWLSHPDRLMRAARHYEEAVLIIIRNAILDRMHLPSTKTPEGKGDGSQETETFLKTGVPITAQCPARIDLFGGWTDTPPICYELGGSVLTLAIKVNGKKPIGAEACLIEEPCIKCKLGEEDDSPTFTFTKLDDIRGYNKPTAQAALIKAVLVFAEYISLDKEAPPLAKQLEGGKGLAIKAWSCLPQGSGLGTSSILAAALLAVVWTAMGKKFDQSHLIHGVLYVEQILTTGGGWQDQVGGVFGGAALGHNPPSLPVRVSIDQISLEAPVLDLLNKHLLLIYTGQVRLAKNIVQHVIREWYLQDSLEIYGIERYLFQRCSQEVVDALKAGDLEKFGNYLDTYRECKAGLARGYEPSNVTAVIKALSPYIRSHILAGAGGGGFLVALLTNPDNYSKVKETLEALPSTIFPDGRPCIYQMEVDTKGLELSIGGEAVEI